MGKRRGRIHRYFVAKDIAERFSAYSDLPPKKLELLVRAVYDCTKDLILACDANDRVNIVGFGTFDIRPLKPAHGRLRHFRTGKLMPEGQEGLKLCFVPSAKIKKELKAKCAKKKK